MLCFDVSWGPFNKGTFNKYVNPEMRETLGVPFHNVRFVKPEKAGQVKPVSEREVIYTPSITVVTYSVNLTWSVAGFLR